MFPHLPASACPSANTRSAVAIPSGTVTSAVTGLGVVTACAFDAAGSGDLILADGADVVMAPAASLAGALPLARSALTPLFNVGGTTAKNGTVIGTIITSVAGTTTGGASGAVVFVFKAGFKPDSVTSNAVAMEVRRVTLGSATTNATLWSTSSTSSGAGICWTRASPSGAPCWFGGTLALTPGGTLHTTWVSTRRCDGLAGLGVGPRLHPLLSPAPCARSARLRL